MKRLSLLVGSFLLMLSVTACEDNAPNAAKPTPANTNGASASTEAKPVKGLFPASNPNADILNVRCDDLKRTFMRVIPGETAASIDMFDEDAKAQGKVTVIGHIPAWDGGESDSWGCYGLVEGDGFSVDMAVIAVDLTDAPASCRADEKPYYAVRLCRGNPEKFAVDGDPTWTSATDSGWDWFGSVVTIWEWVKTSGSIQLHCRVGSSPSAALEEAFKDKGQAFCNAVKEELKFG